MVDVIACFLTCGYTEAGAMQFFLKKINDRYEYRQCLPNKTIKKKGMPKKIDDKMSGRTGEALLEKVYELIEKHRDEYSQCRAILVEDDLDGRFAGYSQKEVGEYNRKIIEKIQDKLGKKLPVFVLYASPEAESWFIAEMCIRDRYQGIPVGGYTKLVANLLEGIEVRLNTDYLENKKELDAIADKVVYTGPIDAYFGYTLGTLEYRSVRFEIETLDKPNFQGNAAVNYTDRETPWTRIIEHKWFEFGKDEEGNDLPKTVISREFSSEWKPGDEPYYPVNDEKNSALYGKYKELTEKEEKVIFGGRLGEYKYYDMDQVIAAALHCCDQELH